MQEFHCQVNSTFFVQLFDNNNCFEKIFLVDINLIMNYENY